MEYIQPYVLSSRTLIKTPNKVTYLNKHTSDLKEVDEGLEYFNIGRYLIKKPLDKHDRKSLETDYPTFETFNDHPELEDFKNYADGNFKPGKHTNQMFEEIFTSLKKTDKILYIYLHGFGNNSESELKKQVIPMIHSYYPHSGNFHSPVGEIIFLTWPSHGFTEYKHGEKYDVSNMAGMTAVFLMKLFYFVKNKTNPLFADGWEPKIAFHAQSMGCKILLNVVERINRMQERNIIKNNILDNFFYRIIMSGADLKIDDMDNADDEIREEIHQWAKRVVLFSNEKDFALWISRFIFLSGRRLGRHLNEKDLKDLPKNVDIVQLKGRKNEFVSHNYFTEEESIITGLQRILSEYYFDGVALENRGRKILLDFNDSTVSGTWMQDMA